MDNAINKYSLGYKIFASSLDNLPTKHQTLVNTINQYSYCVAENDPEFKISLKKADVLLPDGMAIVAAARLIDNIKLKKIAGADIHQYCLEKLNRNNGSCFYLGSSEPTLEKIRNKIAIHYPNIRVQTYSPPFKPNFTEEENKEMIDSVNNFKPDVLFIGMTAPKQEKWAYANKSQLDAQLICSIGAVFDFYADTIKRPNKIWIKLGLEWFNRFVKEPRRLWKRYFYFGPVFLKHIMNLKLNAKAEDNE